MNNALQQLYSELIAEGYSPEEAMQMISTGATGTSNLGSVGSPVATAAPGLLSRFTSGLRDPNKPLIGGSFKLPNIGKAAATLREKPIMEGGPSVGSTARGLGALYYGGRALKGLYENSLAQDDLDSLSQDIRAQVVSNPMYSMYMDASDEKLLRQMNNGTSTEGISNAAEGAMKGLPKAAIATLLGGLTGGVGGAAIGGIGSLVNSGIEGYGKGMTDQQSKLQGLYGRLKQADEEYRQMKRPAGLRRAGLSTQYFNQLY